MNRLLLLIAGIFTISLLTSCALNDPLGATTRQQVRTDGAVRIAEAEAHAQIESARYAAEAQVDTARTWAASLPTVLLIVVGGVLAGIIFYFRGRAYLTQVERSASLSPTPLSAVQQAKLADYARQTGQQLEGTA
jgi:hypothetical protein